MEVLYARPEIRIGYVLRCKPEPERAQQLGRRALAVQPFHLQGPDPCLASSPMASPIGPPAVAATDNGLRAAPATGKGKRTETDQEWPWVTTLPQQAFPTRVAYKLGHRRWRQENNGWMDLTQHWALKHGFLHACQHRPQQTNSSGQREPVHSWSGSRHLDPPDRLRPEFDVRPPALQTRAPRPPHGHRGGHSVACLDLQGTPSIRAPD